MTYYTEYPTTQFEAATDDVALKLTAARVVYRESITSTDGLPFVMLREEKEKTQ